VRAVRGQLVAVMAASGLAVAALVGAGSGALAGPPSGSWWAVEGWYDQVGPAPAALVCLRLVALVGAGWLLVASGLQLLAGLSPAGTVQAVADAVSPLVLRRLAQGVAGLSVTVGLVGPPAPADPKGTAVMEVLGDGQPATTQSPTTQPPVAEPPPTAPPVASTPPPPVDEVVVEPGDSFWSLAVDAVGERARPAVVDDYWRRLIARNRARLVDPGNPDLLYPGQVLVLP
jgi:hypothetical protein